jgi:hypothetical protein
MQYCNKILLHPICPDRREYCLNCYKYNLTFDQFGELFDSNLWRLEADLFLLEHCLNCSIYQQHDLDSVLKPF